MLVGFPLWWVLGLNTFIFPIAAVVMLVQLLRMRRVRPMRFPPAFWIWALYLVWMLLGLAMFDSSPAGTHSGSLTGRLISIGFDVMVYLTMTITVLYIGNLPLVSVPREAIGRWMGWLFLTVAAGGFLGILAPRLSFPSLLELFLPHGLVANDFVKTLVHPSAAQVQQVIGEDNGRPSAPFGYTNSWANVLGIVLLWFVAAWVIPARGRRRWMYAAIAAVTFVPIVLSLNRGLWIGVIFTVVWLAIRQLAFGRIGVLLTGIAAVLIGATVILVSPLHSVIDARLQNGKSNDIRAFVGSYSIKGADESPIIGYGGTRHINGSSSSIAVGPSAKCSSCGDFATGSTGLLWSVMFNNGYGGLTIYFGFFLFSLWVYRRERGAINEAALATIALLFVYSWFYSAVPAAPTLTIIALCVLWRSRLERQSVTISHRVALEPAGDH
ncbi:MAG: hypothetical protein J2P16_00495 [Mycobacterium sp.]|nr:hypothetical protein [Mycobacterium sp.]